VIRCAGVAGPRRCSTVEQSPSVWLLRAGFVVTGCDVLGRWLTVRRHVRGILCCMAGRCSTVEQFADQETGSEITENVLVFDCRTPLRAFDGLDEGCYNRLV